MLVPVGIFAVPVFTQIYHYVSDISEVVSPEEWIARE